MLALTILSLVHLETGSHLSLLAMAAPLTIRSVSVAPLALWVKLKCVPRSRNSPTQGICSPSASQCMLVKNLRVFSSEAKVKHLLTATLAPRSAKNLLLSCMALTVSPRLSGPVTENIKSSASTLGSTPNSFINLTQGTIKRAIIPMEKGHPWGIEHLSLCPGPMRCPT